MSAYICAGCYGFKVWCRRCKTRHCDCSWNSRLGCHLKANAERAEKRRKKKPSVNV